MKTILVLLMLFIGAIANAQEISEPIKRAIEADDSTALAKSVKAANYKLDDCFSIEGTSYTLLAISIKMDKSSVFNYLVTKKAAINKICKDKSPLMFAAKYGKIAMVKALIKAGADVKQMSDEHKTALDYAVRYKQPDIEQYLKSLN